MNIGSSLHRQKRENNPGNIFYTSDIEIFESNWSVKDISNAGDSVWGGQCFRDSDCVELVSYCDKSQGFPGKIVFLHPWTNLLIIIDRIWWVSAGVVGVAGRCSHPSLHLPLLPGLHLSALLLPLQLLCWHPKLHLQYSLLLLLQEERLHSGQDWIIVEDLQSIVHPCKILKETIK